MLIRVNRMMSQLYLSLRKFSYEYYDSKTIFECTFQEMEFLNGVFTLKEIVNQEFMLGLIENHALEKSEQELFFEVGMKWLWRGRERSNSLILDFNYKFEFKNNTFYFYADSNQFFVSEIEEYLRRNDIIKWLVGNDDSNVSWSSLNKADRSSWLNLAYDVSLGGDLKPIKNEVELNGSFIFSEEDLYCYLGEEVYGLLGYMGYNLNSLKDCLLDFPEHSLHITWFNFSETQQIFNSENSLKSFLEMIDQYAILKLIY